MSLCPESIFTPKDRPKCISLKEETSTVEVESSNCVINIEYFAKDEKISLELYKTATDAKCLQQNLERSKRKPELCYDKTSKRADMFHFKLPEKVVHDPYNLRNEKPEKERPTTADKVRNTGDFCRTPSCCSIYFDGTLSKHKKKHHKKSRKTSENVTETDFFCSKTNSHHFHNIEFSDLQKHQTYRTMKEIFNKADDSIILERKKHAKFEIVLTPKSKTESTNSDAKSETSSKRKKVILQSNTLEIVPKNNVTQHDYRYPIDIRGGGEERMFGDGKKFFKKPHRKRSNTVLTMSTTVNADIRGINNIFSEVKEKKRVPQRSINSDEEQEEKPFYIPEEIEYSSKSPRNIDKVETSTEVSKVSHMPRRFIGSESKQDNSSKKVSIAVGTEASTSKQVNINSDESNPTISDNIYRSETEQERTVSSITNNTGKHSNQTKTSSFSPKIQNEEPKNAELMQFCNLMFNMMQQTKQNSLQLNDLKKTASEFTKKSNSTNTEKSTTVTKIPRKISGLGKDEHLTILSDRKEKIVPVLKRTNTVISEHNQKSTDLFKPETPKNKVHFRKLSPKRNKNTNLPKPPLTEENCYSQKCKPKTVVKKVIPKKEEKLHTVKNLNGNEENIQDSRQLEETKQIIEIKTSDDTVKSEPKTSDEKGSQKADDKKISTARTNRKCIARKDTLQNLNKIDQKENKTSDPQIRTLSARESNLFKRTPDKTNSENENICSKTPNSEFKRAKTFCTKTDCMENIKKNIKDFDLIPLTKNCMDTKVAAALKFSESNMIPDCCREKAKFFHVSKNHTPGCIHNSSFLFTKCNTEHTKESSFQKRKEYNKKWREKFHDKEWRKGIHHSDSTLESEKNSQTEVTQDKTQTLVRNLQNLQKSKQTKKSRSKFSIHHLHPSKSLNRFSRTTSIFSFPYQEKPRKNYAEIDLPSFICPDSKWVQKEGNENKINDKEEKTPHKEKDENHPENKNEKEKASSIHSSKTDKSKISSLKTKKIKPKKRSVGNKIRNRFSFGGNKQPRKKLNCCSSDENRKLQAVEEWCNSLNKIVETDKNEECIYQINPIRQHVNYNEIRKNPITGEITSDKTVMFVRNFTPNKPEIQKEPQIRKEGQIRKKPEIPEEPEIEVVHENKNFLNTNQDKSACTEQTKETKFEIKPEDSDDTLVNCKECTSFEIFGEKEVDNVQFDLTKIVEQGIGNGDGNFVDINLNKPDEGNVSKRKKSSKLFSMQKMSSHFGKLFRGKKT